MAHGLDTIERNVRVQAQLIDDLLDMSRIISGRSGSMCSVLSSGLWSKLKLFVCQQKKGSSLQQVLDPLAGIVSGDPARLQQIVWNLLSNVLNSPQRVGECKSF